MVHFNPPLMTSGVTPLQVNGLSNPALALLRPFYCFENILRKYLRYSCDSSPGNILILYSLSLGLLALRSFEARVSFQQIIVVVPKNR